MSLKLRERAAVPARSNREHHNEDSARATERPQAPAPPRVRDTVASGGGRREGQQLCLSLIYIYIYYAHTTFIECIQNYSIYIYIYMYIHIYMYTHIDVYKMCISVCRYKCLDMHTYTYITKHAIPPPTPELTCIMTRRFAFSLRNQVKLHTEKSTKITRSAVCVCVLAFVFCHCIVLVLFCRV